MKLKNVLIAFLMLIGTTLMAQEKYEQATVSQFDVNTGASILLVSVEGQPFKRTKLSGSDFESPYDISPLLKQVATLRNDGWEVWNSSSSVVGFGANVTYFLRRKLK
ncbi:MAG: hypothetical protein JSS76_18310 [Bacteroidetes bacterium]|nr:hypothetical protein [Bacteroidota bacterium]